MDDVVVDTRAATTRFGYICFLTLKKKKAFVA